ncbi:ABC transporter permease [Aquabacterium sp. OR-4]|uniref:ABC transporter permease n=1 Tax=Aquabacterium sp. OR-4 TaxID=2978127 RepID=UPI0021B300D2|nr:ABC transporter permease [Aquabacterium sp. OR-4]MDT7835342.1 ABC transporter permease [Aquabacterium sp. OR-4]
MTRWQRSLAQRLLQAGLVALLVGVFSFLIMRALPGDAAYRIAAARYGYDLVDGAAAAAVRAELGLDGHWLPALGRWLADLAQGRLGVSVVSGEPVWHELLHELLPSLGLAAATLALVALLGLPLGLACGLRPGGRLDRLSLALAVALRALPPFALGLVLILLFAVQLPVLPAAGHGDAASLLLPALTLALPLAATAARVVREAVAAVAASAYWAFGRGKGLPGAVLLWRHGLRNAALPVVAWLGVQAVLLVEGVVIVETLFARPGLGHAMVHAVFGRDVPMIQGTALLLGALFVGFNALVDAACLALDPRRRDEAAE